MKFFQNVFLKHFLMGRKKKFVKKDLYVYVERTKIYQRFLRYCFTVMLSKAAIINFWGGTFCIYSKLFMYFLNYWYKPVLTVTHGTDSFIVNFFFHTNLKITFSF